MGTNQQMLEVFSAMAPLLVQKDTSLRLAPDPRAAKMRRRNGPNSQDADAVDQDMDSPAPPSMMQMIKLLTHLVVRQDQEIQSIRKADQFVLFLIRDPKGALDVLLQETTQWKQQMESGPTVQSMPLRQHLMLALLRALQHRVNQLMECQTTDTLYKTSVEKGLILQDRSFPFHRWDPNTSKLILDKKSPISAKKMGQHLTELSEMFMDRDLVVRFHAMGSTSSQQRVVPWRLQLHLRSDRPYELIYQMAYNSIWMLVGATLKPHSLGQSPMATALQAMVHPNKGQGKGKTKKQGKSQTKQEA